MKTLNELRIKIFADGADLASMKQAYRTRIVKGFTTNPTLLRQAGIADYETFGRTVLAEIPDFPVSFEVLSDDFAEMEREARQIASWGPNVYIKIPITNTKGESSIPLIHKLSEDGIALNITAILTLEQVRAVAPVLSPNQGSIVSIFAGRIADTGRDPVPYIREAVTIVRPNPNAEVLWGSPRELLNIFQAEECGCHIITVLPDILKKLSLIGKDLAAYSLETVKMFYTDACLAGYRV
jgi:transaldolase